MIMMTDRVLNKNYVNEDDMCNDFEDEDEDEDNVIYCDCCDGNWDECACTHSPTGRCLSA